MTTALMPQCVCAVLVTSCTHAMALDTWQAGWQTAGWSVSVALLVVARCHAAVAMGSALVGSGLYLIGPPEGLMVVR